MVKMYPSAA